MDLRRGTIFSAVMDVSQLDSQFNFASLHDRRDSLDPYVPRFTTTIEKLPDKVLLRAFSYLPHREILKCARVNHRWKKLCYDPRLWAVVSFRPELGGLLCRSPEALAHMLPLRMGSQLKLIELPMDLIQPPILHELALKCPMLRYMTLDFSTAVQLHEFNDLQAFPARLRSLTICLSQVIFLEGFVRKIYTFISSLEVLHLIGTYEQVEDGEEEIYEVINIHRLKAHTPNLRVVNFWGVVFVNDDHVEALSTNCVGLECLAINYCQKVKGTCLKPLLHRCKKLKSLFMEHCLLESQAVQQAEWEKSRIEELNITATELDTECLVSVLKRLTRLRWLSAGYLESFNDKVIAAMLEAGTYQNLIALDLHTCDSISEETLMEFLAVVGPQLEGLVLGGMSKLLEHFWLTILPRLRDTKILVMGIQEDCCQKVTAKIIIDQFIGCIADNCHKMERLEIEWDPDTLRFSDKSSKFMDILRLRCLKLHSLTLCDGRYFELVKSNFERADRLTVVRTTANYKTTCVPLLQYYRDLLFN